MVANGVLLQEIDMSFTPRPDLADNHYYELKPGWYVGTNYSRQNIADIIRMACGVASVGFITDLIIKLL